MTRCNYNNYSTVHAKVYLFSFEINLLVNLAASCYRRSPVFWGAEDPPFSGGPKIPRFLGGRRSPVSLCAPRPASPWGTKRSGDGFGGAKIPRFALHPSPSLPLEDEVKRRAVWGNKYPPLFGGWQVVRHILSISYKSREKHPSLHTLLSEKNVRCERRTVQCPALTTLPPALGQWKPIGL